MIESFDIPVLYNGKELIFKGRLINSGYIHKIEVDIYGQPVILEPDEERNYRATADASKIQEYDGIDKALLQEIIAVIEASVK